MKGRRPPVDDKLMFDEVEHLGRNFHSAPPILHCRAVLVSGLSLARARTSLVLHHVPVGNYTYWLVVLLVGLMSCLVVGLLGDLSCVTLCQPVQCNVRKHNN